MRWRPKIRAKNKLRLGMKKILNPKFAKEKVTVIEDSSSQEDLRMKKAWILSWFRVRRNI